MMRDDVQVVAVPTAVIRNPESKIVTVLQAYQQQLPADGLLSVTDWIVPGSHLRGKKANLQREAGRYVTALFNLREGGNGRYYSRAQWFQTFQQANLSIQNEQIEYEWVDFVEWVAETDVNPANRLRLRAMILQAPAPVLEFLTPQITSDKIHLRFTKLTLLLAPS